MTDETKPAVSDDDIIKEALEYYNNVIQYDSENRTQALADLEFLLGDQWDQGARQIRQVEQRPCLTINKLPAFLAQVTNDQRKNKVSIKTHAVDEDADDEIAEILQGLIRHIEYSSNADVAYDRAINSAAAIGFGYYRLTTDYCNPKSFDQEIRFKSIRNPFTVYFDPYSTEPDGSDQKKCLISEEMPREDFKRQYPKSEASNDSFLTGTGNSAWINKTSIRIGEYYRIEETEADLYLLADGSTVWADELIAGVMPVDKRKSTKRKVMWYKITGVDILERAEIKCNWIPVFPVYGAEVDINGKVFRSGMIRNAKDPAKMYNVWMTAATEEIASRAKAPYIGAEGQFEGHEKKWRQANVRNFPYLEYKPKTADGQLAPPPQRQPMADIPVGVLTMAQHASDDIKATTGIYDASLGARSNETSGRAIFARQQEGDNANFHFTDNRNRTIRHTGRCIISMVPNYYDATRIIRIMGEDGKIQAKTINQPLPPEQQEVDEYGNAIKTVLNDLTVGEFDVTESVGPAYETALMETADKLVQLAGNWPELMALAGDKVIQAMDIKGGDEIADRIKRSMPPNITGDGDQDPKAQLAAQAQQMAQMQQALQMSEQHMQDLEQKLQKAESGTEREMIKAQAQAERESEKNALLYALEQIRTDSAERIAAANNETRADVAELAGMVQLLVQKMQPPPALASDVNEDLTKDDA